MAKPLAPAPSAVAPTAAREAVVAVVALVVLGLVGWGITLGFFVGNLHNGLVALASVAVGLYVLRVRPGHRVARLFVAGGVVAAVMFAGRQYALGEAAQPAAPWLAWISIGLVPIAIVVAGAAVMLFPDGKPLSSRWRVVVLTMSILGVAAVVPLALWPLEDDWSSLDLRFPLDVGGRAWAERNIWPVVLVYFQASQVVWAIAVVQRMRTAAGDEVRQLRWFAYAVAIVGTLVITGFLVAGTPVPGLLALPLIPVAAGVAIVKYRLYDIDPVVNKSIVVGVMAGVVIAGYAVVVLGVGSLVPVSDRVLSVVATALVAVAFAPLMRRVQRVADRIVYGHRSTPYETLSRLSAQLGNDGDTLVDGLAATVAGATGASEVVVWVGSPSRLTPAGGWPGALAGVSCRLDELELQGWQVRPIVRRGAIVGALTIRKRPGDPVTGSERQLLDDVVASVGLVIDHLAQADELRATARRVVTAQDETRRRIERNLHDGAQQRLVTLALELGGLRAHVGRGRDHELVERVDRAQAQLREATAELREMARGIHPSVLTQDGLEAALGYLADRSPLPVRLHVDVGRRLAAEVEASAYFLVSESITNAARHSGARLVTVTAVLEGDRLRVEVTDDGRGGADLDSGTGLQGLADRLAALGARLTVDSPAEAGTCVRAVFRCE